MSQSDVMQKILNSNPTQEGRITINVGSASLFQYRDPPEFILPQDDLSEIEDKLTIRFDDPRYYFGTP